MRLKMSVLCTIDAENNYRPISPVMEDLTDIGDKNTYFCCMRFKSS